MLSACEKSKDSTVKTKDQHNPQQEKNPEVLPYLGIEELDAKFAKPKCSFQNCFDIQIQTIKTQDQWLNQWIGKKLSEVIQSQIGLEQKLSLQEAINAYAKKSNRWQSEFVQNTGYELKIQSKVAAQRNQYVLFQVVVNSKQAEVIVKDRGYFYVSDRVLKQNLLLTDVLEARQTKAFDQIIQNAYQQWLPSQTDDVQTLAPKRIDWKMQDWFFDQEGIGVHYRASEIVKDAQQFDIFLNKKQTQAVLKPKIFQKMF